MSQDLNALAVDLTRAAAAATQGVRPLVQKGALNIKQDAQRFASGIGHAPHYPRSITYDTKVTATGVEAEIGPDKNGPQGALGNILEYGTSKNAPLAHLGPAFDREVPRLVSAAEALAEAVL